MEGSGHGARHETEPRLAASGAEESAAQPVPSEGMSWTVCAQ